MDQYYTLELHPQFVELSLDLDRHPTPETLVACWTDVAAACSQNKTRRVLAKLNIPLRELTVTDIFEMTSYLAKAIPGMYVAVVVQEDDSEEQRDFFQLAASNRGLTIDFFTDYEAAVRWLHVSSQNQ